MVVLVVLLLLTNVGTLAALVAYARRQQHGGVEPGTVEVFEAPRPAGVTGRDRRLITVEILNPFELASARGGRVAGLASTLAPGFTRRVVYDQTLKALRRELEAQAVHADVRVHRLRATGTAKAEPAPPAAGDPRVVDTVVVDQVEPLDLGRPASDADR